MYKTAPVFAEMLVARYETIDDYAKDGGPGKV